MLYYKKPILYNMTIFKDYLLAWFGSVSMKNTNYLVECCILKEYVDLSFTKEETIDSLIHIRTKITDQKDIEDIIDLLNNEFINVGVMFNYTKDTQNYKYSYKEAGILKNEFDPERNLVILTITDIFLNNLLNKNDDILATSIIASCTHEDTHGQQYKLSQGKVKGTQNTPINTNQQLKDYLKNTTEIDAHARETAAFLYNKGISAKQIINMIKTNSKELMNLTAYRKYWDTFGIMSIYKGTLDNDGKERLKVWKRFLKRIIAYLLTTTKYKYNDSDFEKILPK